MHHTVPVLKLSPEGSHVKVPIEGLPPAREGEEWEWHRNGHVYAHHTHFNLILILTRCWPRFGEDCCAIAVWVAVH